MHQRGKPEREIVILTLSRSGHHAIINWIARQWEGTVIHQNNCVRGWEENQLLPFNEVSGTKIYGNQYDAPTLAINSIETFDMADFWRYSFWVTEQPREFYLILRDPYNWIASCWAGGGEGRSQLSSPFINERGEEKQPTIQLWKKQAEYVLGSRATPSRKINFISFNSWFSDIEYRAGLAEDLQIPFTDVGVEEMPQFGGGSSFSGLQFDGMAHQLGVLNRWHTLSSVPEYLELIEDEELAHAAYVLFSMEKPI